LSVIKIAILMACHNRVEVTKRCLQSLDNAQLKTQDIEISLFAVDDGSTDGTSEVLLNWSSTKILIEGTGNWYWARSMSIAESKVPDDYDGYLWLNDDVELFQNSLKILHHAILEDENRILIGQVASPFDGTITYGGVRQVGWKRNFLQLIDTPVNIDLVKTFNGNFVYIPMSIAKKLGKIDGKFLHGYADFDYGLRASKMGIPLFVLREVVGECAPNNSKAKYTETLHQLLFEKKGMPLKSQIRFFTRHGGPEWLIYVIYPFYKYFRGKLW
jgi:GT2 family glycosyltransferase